jgi:hypothetical protein
MWFDSVVHSAAALRHLLAVVGDRQVVMGSDHPFEMGATRTRSGRCVQSVTTMTGWSCSPAATQYGFSGRTARGPLRRADEWAVR